LAGVGCVLLDDLRVLVIHAGQQVSCGRIKYHQMIGVGAGSRFVLCCAFLTIHHADSAFAGAVHAATKGMHRLDNGGTKGGLRFLSVD